MSENPTQSVPATEVVGKTLVEEFMVMSYEFRRNEEMNVKYQHVNDLITTFLIQLATPPHLSFWNSKW